VPIAIMCVWIGFVVQLNPSERKLTWFELATDGYAHDKIANRAQEALFEMWDDGFSQGHVDAEGTLSHALATYLTQLPSSSHSLLELAAGGGGVGSMLTQRIREKHAVDARVVLTDLQPDLEQWATVQERFGTDAIVVVNSSVDATDVKGSLVLAEKASVPSPSLDAASRAELRMIFAAFHHFTPGIALSILRDAVQSGGAILIGDIKPSVGAVLWNWALSFVYLPRAVKHSVAREGFDPMLPLLLTAAPLIAFHDATVSSLRAYSAHELQELLRKACALENVDFSRYFVQTFDSAPIADWIGMPRHVWQRLPSALGFGDPAMQFFFAAPRR